LGITISLQSEFADTPVYISLAGLRLRYASAGHRFDLSHADLIS
jgi:hypothetical protein